MKPAEAAAAAQLKPMLGTMDRFPAPPGNKTKTPDFIITDGPNIGKTVDAMYATDKLSVKEVENLNKYYSKSMENGSGTKVIMEHLSKADYVPVDFRVLNSDNQKIFIDFAKTLPDNLRKK